MDEWLIEDYDTVMLKALKAYGVPAQLDMMVEESSELIKAVCKLKRDPSLMESFIDEMADVYIMLRQMELAYGIELEVEKHVCDKLNRLDDRLKTVNGA
jgi:NTP pyrophosphatase (non-canonical NTP hydrolase)